MGCTVASTHVEFCTPSFARDPYTYVTKDSSSSVCIDYLMYSGPVGVGTQSIGVEPSCVLYRFNDHFPIGGLFTTPPLVLGDLPPLAARSLMMSVVLGIQLPTLSSLSWWLLPPPFRCLLSLLVIATYWKVWWCGRPHKPMLSSLLGSVGSGCPAPLCGSFASVTSC